MSLAAGPPAGRNPETGLWDVLLNLQAALPIRVSEGKLVYLFCEQIGQIGRSTYAYSITAWPVYRLMQRKMASIRREWGHSWW